MFSGLSLGDAERLAVASSPDIAAARARLDQSRYELDAARSVGLPSFISNYTQVPQGNPPGPNITSRQVGAGLQWTIGDFIAFAPAAREAALTLAAAQADEQAAESAENVKVIGLYFEALKARAVADARRSALALAVTQHDAATVRVKAGDAPQLDVVRSEVEVAKAQADLESAIAGDQNASEALRVETGVAATALEATVPVEVPPIAPALLDPQAVVATAQKLRPEIASARLTAEAAQAAVGTAKAAGFPALTVSGGYVVGTDSGVPVNAPTINANLSLAIGPGSHDRVAIAAAKAVEARARTAGIERQILLDVAASARTLGASQRAAAATSRARQSAEAELHATEIGYRSGASSSLEVASARSTYVQAAVEELSARYDLQKAQAILETEVGR
jgi:outer membrane protein TolC